MTVERMWVTVDEFAAMAGLKPWAVRAGIRRGHIPSERIGRNVRLPIAELRERWPRAFGKATEAASKGVGG